METNTKQIFQNITQQFIQIENNNTITKMIQKRQVTEHPPDLCIVNIFSKKKFNLLDKREELKSYYFCFFGIQTYPQTLSVFSNFVINQYTSRSKSQCFFHIWNSFDQSDLVVQIKIPGGIKLSILEDDGNHRSANKQDLQKCYVSSILRYMLSVLYENNYENGYTRDPFTVDQKIFINFLDLIFRITKTNDIKLIKNLWYEQMLKNLKNALYLLSLYTKHTKRTYLVQKYFNQQNQKDPDYIRKNSHLIQFYLEVFLKQQIFNNRGAYEKLFSDIRQILCILNEKQPIAKYYLSFMTSKIDEQIYILKNISYANKNQIWLKLSNLYLNQKYSNFDILAKGITILNLLAIKTDKNINKPSFTQNQQSNHIINQPKKKFEYFSLIQRFPSAVNVLFVRDITITIKQTPQISILIHKLKLLLERLKRLELIQKQIVHRLLKLITLIGKQKFSDLYSRTFDNIKKNIDSIQMFDQQPKNISYVSEKYSEISQPYLQKLPSFIVEPKKQNMPIKNTRPSGNQSDQDQQLPRITQETILTLRQENINHEDNLDENSEIYNVIESSEKKRIINDNFLELLNLTLDIKSTTDEIFKKLCINQKQFNATKLSNLKIQSYYIIAQASQISGINLIAAYSFIFIKKRIIDMYTYYKLIRLLGCIKDIKCQLLLISDLIKDMRYLGIVDMPYLPIWIQEEFFNILSKKGRVFVQTILKSNNLNQPIIIKSIQKYFSLYK